jgi:hypothetical protein
MVAEALHGYAGKTHRIDARGDIMPQMTKDTTNESKTPTDEIEDGIAACFMRQYKMIPVRVPTTRPNYQFFESRNGMDKGRFRGSAAVIRIYGDMGKLDLTELGRIFWGDEKGVIIVGFDDLCAMKTRDRANFITICERRGCYE